MEALETKLLESLRTVLLFVERDQNLSLETESLNKLGIVVTITKSEDRKFLDRFEL